MTQQELIQADFQAKAALIEAERGYIRSQITLLEAQLKQNTLKGQELEFQWGKYVESQKAAAERQVQVEQNGTQTATPSKTKKAPAKA